MRSCVIPDLNSDVGITSSPHAQVAGMKDVSIFHNTLYGHGDCLYLRWSGAATMTLANNAIYCPGATAVNAGGLEGAGISVSSNYVEGGMSGAQVDGSRFSTGGSAVDIFSDPAVLDFWLRQRAALIGAADPAYAPGDDFNAAGRLSPMLIILDRLRGCVKLYIIYKMYRLVMFLMNQE